MGLSTLQIGQCGVLLIQYRLLRLGFESAPMTTDTGVDLVVYSAEQDRAYTVQVKTCLEPKRAGGRGKPALDWWMPNKNAAQVIGLVDLKQARAWLFGRDEFHKVAQQNTGQKRHLYMYAAADHWPPQSGCHEREFSEFLLERKAEQLFGHSENSASAVVQ